MTKRVPPAEQLQAELEAYGVPYKPEFLFAWEAMKRKWRADYALIYSRVLVELDGGTWQGGRHSTGKGYQADCEKLNAATLLGWRLIRVTPAQVYSGYAIKTVLASIGREVV